MKPGFFFLKQFLTTLCVYLAPHGHHGGILLALVHGAQWPCYGEGSSIWENILNSGWVVCKFILEGISGCYRLAKFGQIDVQEGWISTTGAHKWPCLRFLMILRDHQFVPCLCSQNQDREHTHLHQNSFPRLCELLGLQSVGCNLLC